MYDNNAAKMSKNIESTKQVNNICLLMCINAGLMILRTMEKITKAYYLSAETSDGSSYDQCQFLH